jgi:hypothetical protein
MLLAVGPVLAHGGLSAGSDNVATVLVVLAIVMLAWFRILQRRSPKGERQRWLPALPAGAAVMLVLAVVTPSFVSTTASKTRPVTTARLAIVAPAAGATTGRKVDVRLALQNAKLAPLDQLVNGKLPSDRGHIHLTLDRQLLMIPSLDYTLDVTPGPHTLLAEFVAIDHASFRTPVVASVQFTTTG